ncbi:hypothetical protein LEP1GSC150_5262 [Leptospira interrogans serovar Copenhageni str. LT2050]|uniref:Uncharacterized protein n=2 Tax=Leptospira interrogans TaxID=173 RepID=M6H832_LEPIR|nr:hypothetical protein LEP1GSC150_5262 [Leptospira interrogans serovar Copenhageni str. LT2050]EMM93225.1 hypothetical protein LEP1GSC158_4851 [Leptospira interrogans serovar Zanoni str. LT2156]
MKLNKLFLIFGIFFLFNVLGCKKNLLRKEYKMKYGGRNLLD